MREYDRYNPQIPALRDVLGMPFLSEMWYYDGELVYIAEYGPFLNPVKPVTPEEVVYARVSLDWERSHGKYRAVRMEEIREAWKRYEGKASPDVHEDCA